MTTNRNRLLPILGVLSLAICQSPEISATDFQGQWVEGNGDATTLEAIDAAFESTQPSARMVCLPLFYKRDWNGLVEGPAWASWWTQNSFGATYALLPFIGGTEPYATWIANSQAMWFDHMGDGQRKDRRCLVAPDGCLCDHACYWMNGAAEDGFGDPRRPPTEWQSKNNGQIRFENVMFKQGDGKADADWYSGGAVAGLILESERLLVRHDKAEAKARLGNLKRVAAFLDSYRDRTRNLLMGGKGCNLLAPTYPGGRQKDGSMGKGYLTELSVNYVAALERLAEVCLLCDEHKPAEACRATAQVVRAALSQLMTPDGYFIRAEDPDGTRRGIFGAAQYGAFEAHPNHDAGCFRVTTDAQNKTIVRYMLDKVKGAAPPGGLAPYSLILPNYPGYDDHPGEGNMTYATWNNGGGWPANQGLMSVAAMRASEFAHPLAAWAAMRPMMVAFRADAPLAGFGRFPWRQPQARPYCFCYDNLGVPAGLLRGLFEYSYSATGVRLWPHIPPGIQRYAQRIPATFGHTRLWLAANGQGEPVRVPVNGRTQRLDTDGSLFLPLNGVLGDVEVEFLFGSATPAGVVRAAPQEPCAPADVDYKAVGSFLKGMEDANLGDIFEAGQARVIVQMVMAQHERRDLSASGRLNTPTLDNIRPPDLNAVDRLYSDQTRFLLGGLVDHLAGRGLRRCPISSAILRIATETGFLPAVPVVKTGPKPSHPN